MTLDPYDLFDVRSLLSEEERAELHHSIMNLNHYLEKRASTPR